MAEAPRMPEETGVPDAFLFMHPTMKENYGAWKFYDRPRPGVLHHVAKSGDEIWSVRCGTQRQLDLYTIRLLADIADEFSDGFLRFTTRNNVEFLCKDESRVTSLVERLTE